MLMLYPSKWTPVVLEHFNKFVSPSIQYHSGKWVIEEYPGMFDPYSGITNNLSESMNAVLKRENDCPLFCRFLLIDGSCIKIKKLKMSIIFLSMCDVKIFLTFTSPNMVLL